MLVKVSLWQEREKDDPDEITVCGAIPGEFVVLYRELWSKSDLYARENLKGKKLEYFHAELDQ